MDGSICYLCGGTVANADISRDHVPAKQFFASGIRQVRQDLQLVTLPSHGTCNASYSADEEYFITSFGPLAYESVAGAALWADFRRKAARPAGQALFHKIVEEFDRSGIILPDGKMVRHFDGKRASRVVWKIVRGLYFIEKGIVLPEACARRVWIHGPDDGPPCPEVWGPVMHSQEGGVCPGVFAYKQVHVPEKQDFSIWGLLFWNRVMGLVAAHGPTCTCQRCRELGREA